MVKLYFLAIVKKQPLKNIIVCSYFDLSDFNYFQKKGVREFMRFSCLVLVGRTEQEAKMSVRERGYVCHSYVRDDELSASAVTDDEYPTKIAHLCLIHLLSEFSSKVQPSVWMNVEDAMDYPDIKDVFQMFSNPKSLDSMSVVRHQLDETRIVLHQTLESILQRGEKLDDLVNKADELSLQAKTFYKTARKTNSCCTAL